MWQLRHGRSKSASTTTTRPGSTTRAGQSSRGAPRKWGPHHAALEKSGAVVASGTSSLLLSGLPLRLLRSAATSGSGSGRGRASRCARPHLPSLRRPAYPYYPFAAHDELLLRRRHRAASAVLASRGRRRHPRRRGATDGGNGGRRWDSIPRGPVPRGGARQPSPPPHEYVPSNLISSPILHLCHPPAGRVPIAYGLIYMRMCRSRWVRVDVRYCMI